MSLDKPERVHFSYNAHAGAFGARLTQPTCDTIPSQASVMLAPSGGEGFASVRNFNYKGIITFDEAHTYVSGSEEVMNGKRVFNTLATVTVRNLNVGNVVTADLITARVASRHDEDGEENFITLEGSFIRGLTIASVPVTPRFDTTLFARFPTYEMFNKGLAEGQTFEDYARRFAWNLDDCRSKESRSGLAPPQKRPGVIRASLLSDLPEIDSYRGRDDINVSPVTRDGYVVSVREFGKIYIGEVIVKKSERRLNLLRFDLGCTLCGDASGGFADGNGTPIGPP
ncbi:MAG TPA: hypothetical protein VGR02_05025 [Thermoanaerobaculia bacterium]|jgi:hypothetical protein|nr:hypothetical protein [Thermoanaerobaculia bacterium]